MGYAIELYFDTQAEQELRQIWQALAEAGVKSILPVLKARPHVSLAVFDSLDREALYPVLETYSRHFAQFSPFTIQFASVGTFPGPEGVVFLAPVVSETLLARHAELHEALKQIQGQRNRYYLPGHWVPHCTLATDLAADDLERAVGIIRAHPWPATVTITEIGLIEFRPVVEHYKFSVGSG